MGAVVTSKAVTRRPSLREQHASALRAAQNAQRGRKQFWRAEVARLATEILKHDVKRGRACKSDQPQDGAQA